MQTFIDYSITKHPQYQLRGAYLHPAAATRKEDSDLPISTVTIGSGSAAVILPRTAMLAPMASVADRAYRTLCMEYGAACCVSEMVSAKAISYGDLKSAQLLAVSPAEEPMSIQLFGSEPSAMAFAAQFAVQFRPKFIDVNMGCPVPKVAGQGCGSALMKTPRLAADIIRAMADAVPLPITVKIRKGWDDGSVNAVEFAKRMEAAGAAAITVHGRTRQQMYSPPVDREIIRQVKEAVSVPVIGNGGIMTAGDAAQMYRETGCDLVMVAQGSYGRPWIFREISHYLDKGELLPEPPLSARLDVLLRHVHSMVELSKGSGTGERVAMHEARKIAGWYIRGARGAAAFRRDCCRMETFSELVQLVQLAKQAEDYAEL